MTLRLGSVALRWMPDDERESFRARELDFLLTVPSRIRLWLRAERPGVGSPLEEELVGELREDYREPQERRLWMLHPKGVNLREHLRRLGVEVLGQAALPRLSGAEVKESVTSMTLGARRVAFLQPTAWPPYLFPGLLAPLFTFDPPIDVLIDLAPLNRLASIHLLRQRIRAFKPHRQEDPLWSQSSDDTETLLGAILQRTNRLFRAALVVCLPSPDEERRLERLVQVVMAEGLTLSPVPFGQRACLDMFSDDLQADPPLSRLLDAVSVTHMGLFEWATPPRPVGGVTLGYDPDHCCLISYNRPSEPNPSALVLGTPGSGKSTFSKVDLLRSMESNNGRAVIFDPEGEYGLLVRHLQGMVISLSDPGHPINPLASFSPGDVEGKITRLPRLLAAGLGEEAEQRVRAALKDLYERSLEPTLAGLLTQLPSSDPVRTRLWTLTSGPLRGLGLPGPGVPESQILSFDLSQFDAGTVGMAVPYLLELLFSWTTVFNRTGPLFVTLDEIHVFLRDPSVRSLLVSLLKRARKTGLVITGITQNVRDFFLTDEGSLLVANAGTVLLFRQSPEDMRVLVERFRLSDVAVQWLERVAPGEGLAIAKVPVPIVVPLTGVERLITNTTPVAFRRRSLK